MEKLRTDTDTCPHCNHEVTLEWNTGEFGYSAFCPYCGEKLMLCDLCNTDQLEQSEILSCDWNDVTKLCFRCRESSDPYGLRLGESKDDLYKRAKAEFNRLITAELDAYTKKWLDQSPEKLVDSAWDMAKHKDIADMMINLSDVFRNPFVKEEIQNPLYRYEIGHGGMLEAICEFELENYEDSMWTDWDDLSAVISDFLDREVNQGTNELDYD